MKIFDCTLYYDEDLILETRLNILEKHIHKFVICESTFTHSGNDKKIRFDPNNFKKFKEKIIHVIIEKDPVNRDEKKTDVSSLQRLNSIKRIEFQRNEILNKCIRI